jgi:hypothetical protein
VCVCAGRSTCTETVGKVLHGQHRKVVFTLTKCFTLSQCFTLTKCSLLVPNKVSISHGAQQRREAGLAADVYKSLVHKKPLRYRLTRVTRQSEKKRANNK